MAPQLVSGRRHVPVRDLLREEPAAEEFAAVEVMRHIAWAHSPEVWDHPQALIFLRQCLSGVETVEFKQFLTWLSTKPLWSPYRVKWSIFDKELVVADQIDSLWFDTARGNAVVIFLYFCYVDTQETT